VCCSVLQCVAVCCSVLQCVAVCCSVLQCVAVCCSVLQCVAHQKPLYMSSCNYTPALGHTASISSSNYTTLHHTAPFCTTLHHTAPRSTTLQHTATYCTILQHTLTNLFKILATHIQPQHTIPHCTTLQHTNKPFEYTCQPLPTATRCTTLQHTVPHCNELQHTKNLFEILIILSLRIRVIPPRATLHISQIQIFQQIKSNCRKSSRITQRYSLLHTNVSKGFGCEIFCTEELPAARPDHATNHCVLPFWQLLLQCERRRILPSSVFYTYICMSICIHCKNVYTHVHIYI